MAEKMIEILGWCVCVDCGWEGKRDRLMDNNNHVDCPDCEGTIQNVIKWLKKEGR